MNPVAERRLEVVRSNEYPSWRVVFAALVVLVTTVGAVGQARNTTKKRQAPTAKSELALADFYYKNDDITDMAAQQYRKVRNIYVGTNEAATAQYFLGSYYHRKFYIQKEKKLTEDRTVLTEAQAQYEDYISKDAWRNKQPEWLSDAYFNLALIFLQRGMDGEAEQSLGKMYGAAPYDSQVYIYQVVWSPSSDDVIDARVDSRKLAEYTNSLVYDFRNSRQQMQRPLSFAAIVTKVGQWCKQQK
jgi:hypothetical protein